MDVIWLSSYPKSGNTWVSFLISAYTQGDINNWREGSQSVVELMQHLGKPDEVKSDDEIQEIVLTDFSNNKLTEYSPGRPIVKTHFLYSQKHPLINNTFSAILITRNLRNILLSAVNHMRLVGLYRDLSDTEIARRFISHGGDPIWAKIGFGSWEEHIASWTSVKDFPVLVIRYEDLLRATETELEKIINFIGLPVNQDRIKQTVQHCSFENMQKLESDLREKGGLKKWESNHSFVNKANTAESLSSIDPDIDSDFNRKFQNILNRYDYY